MAEQSACVVVMEKQLFSIPECLHFDGNAHFYGGNVNSKLFLVPECLHPDRNAHFTVGIYTQTCLGTVKTLFNSVGTFLMPCSAVRSQAVTTRGYP